MRILPAFTLCLSAQFVICSAAIAQAVDTPPTTPGNPTARAYGPTSGGIAWQRSRDDRRVVGYEITRDGTVLGVRDALSYVANDLDPGRGYNFAIVAIDSAGQRSGRALSRIETPDARPNRPTGLSATVYSSTAAGITWNRSNVFGERYEVKRDGEIVAAATNGTSYIDSELSARRPYLFEVIAVNRQGQRSSAARLFVDTREGSGEEPPMTQGPAAPGGLRSVIYSSTAGAIAWDRASTAGLRYEVSRDGQVVSTTGGTSFVDDNLTDGQSYVYAVVAIDRQGERSDASTVSLDLPSEPSGPSDEDPPATDSTRVDVEITVPARVSNELTVELTWGTKRIMAEWVGDEQWRATVDFPRAGSSGGGFPGNDYLLAVNFRDRNGDILLGRAEAFYRVREDIAEPYTVLADDFDTERWDDDSDGASNLDELRRGSDPLVADTPLPPESLDELESLFLTQSLSEGATYFEPRFLELELPVDDQTEVVNEGGSVTRTTLTDVDFSADGNGTFRERYKFEIEFDRNAYREEHGTRSHEGDAVTWSGVRWTEGSSLAVREETTFDITSTLDGRELSQQGEGFVTSDAFFGSELDFVSYRYDVVLDLDSRDDDDTCVALRGNILSVIKNQGDQGSDPFESTRAVSRDSTSEQWTWSGVDNDGTRVAGVADGVANRFYCGFRFEP